jgi:glycosyltransferase involved in cell wall biosynthesis
LQRLSSDQRTSLRVLHVSQPADGGAAVVVAHLVKDQFARGHDVAVACSPEGELAAAVEAAGARLVPWAATRQPGLRAVSEARSLARIFGAEHPDLVHLHSSKAGLAGRLALRGRLPTIFQPHGWSFEAVRGPHRVAATHWERRATRWTDAIACVSEGERQRGKEMGIRASFRVVSNGVDLGSFPVAGPDERAIARARLGLGDGPLVVCVGRLCEAKGQDVLVRSWPRVRERVGGAQLLLVGDGPEEPELRRAAGAGVELIGARRDVRNWLVAADVVAAPSRWDGLSLVLLEALACGRSIVATNVPGAREALGAEAGAIVPVEAPAALAAAVTARLLDPALAVREGAAARGRAERLFDLRATHERMAAVYAEVLAGRRRSTAPADAAPAPATP